MDLEGATAGSVYDKYLSKGNITYLGKVHRVVNYRGKEVMNTSFANFCKEKNIAFPSEYRKIKPNPVAGLISLAKYDKAQPQLNSTAWKMSYDFTLRHFSPCLGERLVSHDDVINDMDKTTSCGYPWNLMYQNKADFFKSESVPILEEYYARIALPENVPVPIWTNSQKEELRAKEKIEKNSIRTFTAAPIEHSYATNRLCLAFNNRFYATANKTWSFVGSSKFFGGWDAYIKRLSYGSNPSTSKVKSCNAFELDESEYDSSLFSAAMFGQCELRYEMMAVKDRTPDNKVRLQNVYDAIINSVIVLENGDLVQKHTGNPSGCANTIVDNTMILYRLFAYAYIMLCFERDEKPSYIEFSQNVEAALNGDDNTYTTSDAYVSWFTPKNIARIWKEIGVTTNTPSESPREVTSCAFLSQNSVYDSKLKMWMPAPETHKVLCSLAWGSDINDVRWHLLRAYALRIDSYGNKECRTILAEYIEYLLQQYRSEMQGVCTVTQKVKLTMQEIYAVGKSEAWLDALYSGLESSGEAQQEFKEFGLYITNPYSSAVAEAILQGG